MKRWLKWLLVMGAGALALVSGGAWWGLGWVKQQVSRESLVEWMEQQWNVRATVQASELDWRANPARLTLRGVDLRLPEEVEDKDARGIRLPEAVLEVSLLKLLQGELEVHQLTLRGLYVREAVDENGVSTLQRMFESAEREGDPMEVTVRERVVDEVVEVMPPPQQAMPKVSEVGSFPPEPGQLAPPLEEATSAVVVEPVSGESAMQREVVEAETLEAGEEREPAAFEARQLGLTMRVHEARIEGGRLYLINQKTGIKTWLEGVELALTDIDVDPSDLAAHNQVKMTLSGELKVEGKANLGGKKSQPVTFAQLPFEAEGELQPFSVETGVWDPVSRLELTLARGGQLAGYMTLAQASEDAAKALRQYGLDLGDLPVGGELAEDAVFRLAWQGTRWVFLDDTHFTLPAYELQVSGGSWLDSGMDQQDLQFKILCGKDLQDELLRGMVRNGMPSDLMETVKRSFTDPDGRLAFDLRASGRISKPSVGPAWDKALQRVLQGGGLDGLLRSLIR